MSVRGELNTAIRHLGSGWLAIEYLLKIAETGVGNDLLEPRDLRRIYKSAALAEAAFQELKDLRDKELLYREAQLELSGRGEAPPGREGLPGGAS